MPELVGMLGTIAALLTLVGSYRLAGYFFNRGPELAGLLAVGMTVTFLMLFELLMLLMGVLTLVAPVAALAHHYGWSPAAMLPSGTGSGSSGSSSGSNTSGGSTGGSNSGGSAGSGSGTGTQCPNCGEKNDPDATFCANDSCGYRLDT